MKKFGKIVFVFMVACSFSTPFSVHAQSVDMSIWTTLNELQDTLVVLYNRANDVQDGVIVPPVQFDTDLAYPSCTVLMLYNNLSIGSTDATTGGDVSRLQQYLRNTGYYSGPVTGYYGALTASAVSSWKNVQGIGIWTARASKDHGVVDQIMRAMLTKSC